MKITIEELLKIIEGNLLTDNDRQAEIEITGGYVSDLLSDVMGNAGEKNVWITIMRHLNAVAVASLVGINPIIFARNLIPDEAVIMKANAENICLLNSSLSTFEIVGRIYNLLNLK